MIERKQTAFISLFFGLLFLLGLFIVDDYGMSWDETYSRNENGIPAYNFVVHHEVDAYKSTSEKYHGVAVELPLYAIERALQLNDLRTIWLFRHFMTYLLFIISAFFFYKLILKLYDDWPIALAGMLIYVFTPRIFADAFYNSKDVAFLSIFTIAMYTSTNFLFRKNFKTILINALVCGFLIDIRITGVLLPIIFTMACFVHQFINGERIFNKRFISLIATYTLATIASTILFWPLLWFGPLTQFKIAWVEASHYHWNNYVLYLGKLISSENIPWHYLPVWIGITTPVITLVLSLSAIIIMKYDFIRNKFRVDNLTLINAVFALYLFLPLLAIIFLHSVVYDAWRHVYFLHAPMIALCCFTIFKISRNKDAVKRKMIFGILILLYVPSFATIIQLHPYQNLYFNKLKYSSAAEARFDMELDYWGLSYRKALEYIVKTDKRNIIHIKADNYPGKLNAQLLPLNDRKRIVFEDDIKNAEYFIGDYRWMQTEYTYRNEIYSLTVDGAKVMVAYKLK